MSWSVRNEDGALDFPSFSELRRAYTLGLVSAEDEVREPGSDRWQKAGAHPRLAQVAAEKHTATSPVPLPWIIFALLLGGAALWFLFSGRWLLGLMIALGVTAVLMSITRKTFRPTPIRPA